MGAKVPRGSSPGKANYRLPPVHEIREALALPRIEVPERGYMGRPLPP